MNEATNSGNKQQEQKQTLDLPIFSIPNQKPVQAKADNMSINKVTLFQLFIIVFTLAASVIGSKVNKERQLRQQHQKDAAELGYFSDSHGLPTKFGDEDDVIFAKKHNESGSQHLPGTGAGIGQGSVSNVKPSLLGHGGDYDEYDYEEELDHPEENNSHGKDIGTNHGLDSGDYTDGFDTDAIDQIESFGEGSDTTSSLPVFLVEPQSTYVIKNRPAVLQCKASHAFQVSFSLFFSSFFYGTSYSPKLIFEPH